MATQRLLWNLGGRHRWPLAFTYGLTILENVAELLYPLLVGRAIDGLLAGRRSELLVLAAVMLLHVALGSARHVYDTRVFSRVYSDLATSMVLRQRGAGEVIARVAARVSLSREIIDFFQDEVPAIATASISLVGTIVMLFVLDARVGLAAVIALAPVALAGHWFARRAYRLHGALNDVLEREVDVVARGSRAGVGRYFGRLARWRIRVSDAEAQTWGVLDLTGVGLVIAALLIVAGRTDATVGSTFAVLGYVLAYADIIDEVPSILQNLARVRDISARVGTDAAGENGDNHA